MINMLLAKLHVRRALVSAASVVAVSCAGKHTNDKDKVGKPPRQAAVLVREPDGATPRAHVRSCWGFCSGPDAMALVPVTASSTLAFFVRTRLPPSLPDPSEKDIADSAMPFSSAALSPSWAGWRPPGGVYGTCGPSGGISTAG